MLKVRIDLQVYQSLKDALLDYKEIKNKIQTGLVVTAINHSNKMWVSLNKFRTKNQSLKLVEKKTKKGSNLRGKQ